MVSEVIGERRCTDGQGKVYDVTDFLDEHPGGAEIILCVPFFRLRVTSVRD
jgi:hypothetical protein